MSDAESPSGHEATPPPGPGTASGGSPSDFLKAVVGKKVVVRLVSGVDYKGVLKLGLRP
jgi:U6 snRNA-associated Sm-like protein LSm6